MKIIKISALWCPSCLIMNDIIEDVITSKNIELVKYDFDLDHEIVKNYKAFLNN